MKIPYCKKILTIIFFILILVNIGGTIFYTKIYTSFNYWERFPALKKMYYDSVYANKKGKFIRDEYVYAFAAGSLLQGVSPILVNPEQPPLGKYLIALSILLFNNENFFTLVAGIGSLVLLYLLGKQVFSSYFLALLPVLLLSFESLYLNQLLITPLLDILQLVFLLSFFLFFNKAENTSNYKKYFFLANCMLGGFISVKFFGLGITLIAAALTVLLLRKNFQKIGWYLVTLLIAPAILLSMYIPVLFTGYPLQEFLGIQKWIFLYNQGHLTKFFTFFPLFLYNKWYSWWDASIMSDDQWQITWPLSFISFVLVLFFYAKYAQYRNKSLDIVISWTIFYILILQMGYMSARYFVILLPGLFLIMVYCLRTCVAMFLKARK
jgi:hypothetical protein